MKVRDKRQRIDADLDKLMREIQIAKAKEGKMLSLRRVSKGISRMPGLKEALLKAKWEEENLR